MKHVAAAIICLGVLYEVDRLCFDGWYFANANQAVSIVCAMDW